MNSIISNIINYKVSFKTEKIIFTVYKVIFLFLLLHTIYILHHNAMQKISDWTMSDWLINYYDGGFKRRGLMGTLFIFLSDTFGISLKWVVFIFQALITSLLFFTIYKGFIKKKLDLYFLSILFLPFGLPFFFMTFDHFFLVRKDLILLLIASFYLLSNPEKFNKYLLIAFLFIGILIHELMFFYLPFFFYFIYKKEKKINLPFILFTLIILGLEMLGIYYFGGKLNEGNSLEILKERGVVFGERNIFLYKEKLSEFGFIKLYFISNFIMFLEFSFTVFLSLIYVRKYLTRYFREILFVLFIGFLFLLPLLFLAIDWLRFFFIYFMLMYFTIWINLENSKENKVVQNSNKTPLFIIISVPILVFILYIHVNHDILLEIFQLGKIDLSNSK